MLYIKITRDDTVSKMKSWLMFYKFSRVKNISMTMFRKKVCRMILKTRPKPKSR